VPPFIAFFVAGTVAVPAATPVAVLDLAGRGVSWEQARVATLGVRAALLEGQALVPLADEVMAEALTRGHQADLERARDLLAEARRDAAVGRTDEALAKLALALTLHHAAGSPTCRRSEVADVHGWTGDTLLRAGRPTAAVAHFHAAERLHAGWAASRGEGIAPESRAVLAEAAQALALSPPEAPTPGELATLARALDVPWVVTGWIDSQGTLVAVLHHGAERVSEVRVDGLASPPDANDPGYRVAGDRLALLVQPLGAPGPSDRSSEPTEGALLAPSDVAALEGHWWETDAQPWWLWAGLGCGVASGGVAVALAAWEPRVASPAASIPTYDIVVIAPD
jgi:hypothetical protein